MKHDSFPRKTLSKIHRLETFDHLVEFLPTSVCGEETFSHLQPLTRSGTCSVPSSRRLYVIKYFASIADNRLILWLQWSSQQAFVGHKPRCWRHGLGPVPTWPLSSSGLTAVFSLQGKKKLPITPSGDRFYKNLTVQLMEHHKTKEKQIIKRIRKDSSFLLVVCLKHS